MSPRDTEGETEAMSDETLMEMSLRQDRDDARRALDNAVTELDYEKRTSLSLREAYAEMKADYEAQLAASLTRERGLRELLGQWMFWASGVAFKSELGEELVAATDRELATKGDDDGKRMADPILRVQASPGAPSGGVEAVRRTGEHADGIAAQPGADGGASQASGGEGRSGAGEAGGRVGAALTTPGTPETPGLDAATVEACAREADFFVSEPWKHGNAAEIIARRIRSLTSTPSTPKTGEKPPGRCARVVGDANDVGVQCVRERGHAGPCYPPASTPRDSAPPAAPPEKACGTPGCNSTCPGEHHEHTTACAHNVDCTKEQP